MKIQILPVRFQKRMNAYFSLSLKHTACYLFSKVFSNVPMAMISPNSQYISPKSSASSFPLHGTCHGLTYDTILLMVAAFIEKSIKISSQKYFYLKKYFYLFPLLHSQNIEWFLLGLAREFSGEVTCHKLVHLISIPGIHRVQRTDFPSSCLLTSIWLQQLVNIHTQANMNLWKDQKLISLQLLSYSS